MKKLFKLFTMTFMAVALCSCGGDDDQPANGPTPGPNDPGAVVDLTMQNLAGDWKLTAWCDQTDFPNDTYTVYLRLSATGAFELYQVNINASGVVCHTGDFSLNGTTVSGTYSDNTKWGSTYDVNEIRERQFIWTATGTEEVSTYLRTEIPAEILERAEASEGVRSQEAPRFL